MSKKVEIVTRMTKVEVEINEFKVGDIYRHTSLLPSGAKKVYHVRAVVDDTNIVLRHWNARYGWLYHIDDAYSMTLAMDAGRATLNNG